MFWTLVKKYGRYLCWEYMKFACWSRSTGFIRAFRGLFHRRGIILEGEMVTFVYLGWMILNMCNKKSMCLHATGVSGQLQEMAVLETDTMYLLPVDPRITTLAVMHWGPGLDQVIRICHWVTFYTYVVLRTFSKPSHLFLLCYHT